MTDRDRGSDGGMDRLTVRMPPEQIARVEAIAEEQHYPDRSEAIREAVRNWIADHRDADAEAPPEVHQPLQGVRSDD